jgi:dimethylhistidine N-methyltransferase
MQTEYRILRPEVIPHSANGKFALDILEGLTKTPKQTMPVYFYDAIGSELFQRITESPEYYLTRAELDILTEQRFALAQLFAPQPFNLIDLGAGDGRKTTVLLKAFLEYGLKFRYVPIDVSEQAMRQLLKSLTHEVADARLETIGLVAEYFDAIRWLRGNNGGRNVVLFLGSNIGNFNGLEGRSFLHSLRGALNADDYLLIGFDLKKDLGIIERAYNDAAGLTREFNLNLLDRLNRELGADFDRNQFVFRSQYNVRLGAVESWLISTQAQQVHIETLKRAFSFKAWEGILTEYSYKYSFDEIERLAVETGFRLEQKYLDRQHEYFVDALLRVT